METLSPSEYERLVAEIVDGISQSAPELSALSLGWGRTNKVAGASGYSHQIDVSLVGTGGIFLLECKKWNKRAGVEAVLALVARASDILSANPTCTVVATLVSSVGFTRGAKLVANYYNVKLEHVESAHVYGLQLGRRAQVGVSGGAVLSDYAEAHVYRNGQRVDG